LNEQFNFDVSVDNYAVVGNPISHSKSPLIHALFAEQTGQSIYYQAIEVATDCFQQTLEQFQQAGGKGLNITVPFKGEAYASCTQLTSRARQAKSVNTLWFDASGQRCGDTTDGTGLVNDLLNNLHIDLQGISVLILGAGGAVRGILEAICQCRPTSVVIANRTLQRAQDLVDDYQGDIELTVSSFEDLAGKQFKLIINGTSTSLAGDIPPLPDKILAAHGVCYDLMYSNEPTPFVKWGQKQDAMLSVDGLGMLVEQAAEAFYIWRGIRPETAPVIEALRAGS